MGALLITGRWLPSAALLSAGMTLVFMIATAYALATGVEDFHCGCFSTSQEDGPSPGEALARDAILLAVTVWLCVVSCRAEANNAGSTEADAAVGP